MQTMTERYMPKDEDLSFDSESHGVRYAAMAGFTVVKHKDTPTAYRTDIPKVFYVLKKIGDKWLWKRRRES